MLKAAGVTGGKIIPATNPETVEYSVGNFKRSKYGILYFISFTKSTMIFVD
jgi:hypothetical protein